MISTIIPDRIVNNFYIWLIIGALELNQTTTQFVVLYDLCHHNYIYLTRLAPQFYSSFPGCVTQGTYSGYLYRLMLILSTSRLLIATTVFTGHYAIGQRSIKSFAPVHRMIAARFMIWLLNVLIYFRVIFASDCVRVCLTFCAALF